MKTVYPELEFTESFQDGSQSFSWETHLPTGEHFGQSFTVHGLSLPAVWPKGLKKEFRRDAELYAKTCQQQQHQ